jgi:hypothetical protein
MKEIEITNFDLTYDGMYFIEWNNRKIRVFLEINTILKMLEMEGLSNKDVDDIIKSWKPIHFNKVTMVVMGIEVNGKISCATSEFSEEYLGQQNITMIDINLKSSS